MLRQISVTDIAPWNGNGHMDVTNEVVVTLISPEGASELFVAGPYIETIDLCGDAFKLIKREICLDTLNFGPGSRVPICGMVR